VHSAYTHRGEKELVRIRTPKESLFQPRKKRGLLSAVVRTSFPHRRRYRGGADSAYLAWAAHSRALGSRALSVHGPLAKLFCGTHRAVVEEFVSKFGVRHEFIENA